jgi:transcriptional regulator with XRE-family HTH domain
LSVNAFSKKMGVSSTAAWNWDWENTTPTPDKLPKIAQVLGVSVEYLQGANVAPSAPHRATPPRDGGKETLDVVLAEASSRIAALLGIEADRVVITFNLKS